MPAHLIFSELETKTQAILGLHHVTHIVNSPNPYAMIDCYEQGQWQANDLDAMHAYNDLRQTLIRNS